jgi:glycosyltransferase involved in cell wall biosynthesis
MTADNVGTQPRVLVIVPTYDERENLPGALERLRANVPHADLLVVDDGSPDGTGELAEKIAVQDAETAGRTTIHVLHRTGKLGLGTAYITGFRWALERGYDVIVEMDADGSHRAEDLPRLLDAVRDADLVIGGQPSAALARRQHLHATGTGVAVARRDGRLPRLPRRDAREDGARRGRVGRVLLPGRHGVARAARRRPHRRGAHHVRRARARPIEDEPRDRRRGARQRHGVGRRAARASAGRGRPPPAPQLTAQARRRRS